MAIREKDILLAAHNYKLYGIEFINLNHLGEKLRQNPDFVLTFEDPINKCVKTIETEIELLLSVYRYVDTYSNRYLEVIDDNEEDTTAAVKQLAQVFRMPEVYAQIGTVTNDWSQAAREKIILEKYSSFADRQDKLRAIAWFMYHTASDALYSIKRLLLKTVATSFKGLKHEIRQIHSDLSSGSTAWDGVKLVNVFTEHLQRSEITIRKALEKISAFKRIALEDSPHAYMVAEILRDLGGHMVVKVLTTKVSSAGRTDDEGTPRDISKVGGIKRGATESGTVELYYEKAVGEEVHNHSISEVTKRVELFMSEFFESCDRLKGTLDVRTNHLRFIDAIVNLLVTLLQTKHITQYNCTKNYIRDTMTRLTAIDFLRGVDHLELNKHLSFDISMSLEFLYSLRPTTIDSWIKNHFEIRDKHQKSERFLFSSVGDDEQEDPNSFKTMKIFTDDIIMNPDYLKAHSYLMKTSLCNLIYVLTHTSTDQQSTHEHVEVYKLVERIDVGALPVISKPGNKRPELKKILALRKIAVFHHDKLVLTKYYSTRFLQYLLKFDRHQKNAAIDLEGNLIYKLKPEPTLFFPDTKEMPYLESRLVSEDRILTNLEVSVEYIINLLLNTPDNEVYDSSVKDIYIQTKVGLNHNNQITIQPHSPYKHLSTEKLSPTTLWEEPVAIDENNNSESNNVIGINDYSYTIKPDFIINDEFTVSTQAPFYMLSINRSFTQYIDNTMVDSIVNYWFTKRLFERLETLRLEDNPETLNLTEAVSTVEEKSKMIHKFKHLSQEFTIRKTMVNKPMTEILKQNALELSMRHESEKQAPTVKRQFRFPLKEIAKENAAASPKKLPQKGKSKKSGLSKQMSALRM